MTPIQSLIDRKLVEIKFGKPTLTAAGRQHCKEHGGDEIIGLIMADFFMRGNDGQIQPRAKA